MNELSLAVVGMRHPNADGGNRQFEAMLCNPGDPIELRPEPENPHDERAIAVYSERGVQLGYVSAERAWLLGRRVQEGAEIVALVQDASAGRMIIRISFDGCAPSLPNPRITQPIDEWA